ncbi:Thiamine monophosphate synthase [hydrothermal vent metagenome]|uniref:Thiamine monophosphate synthase n=1 Tax=hydrothermal vent metagenome TaxID=652676 RepID=A0A1W1CXV8_9ZZZZ
MIAYAITDPSTLNFQNLKSDIKHFATKANMIVYRDKSTSNYTKNAEKFINEAKKYSFSKILLHSDYTLAHNLKADGVHLTSMQFDSIEKAKKFGLFVIASTHSLEEAMEAQYLGADMITFSPIFATPNKGEPKGIKELNRVASNLSIPIIALGGIITKKHLLLCQKSKAKGFASIRWFS